MRATILLVLAGLSLSTAQSAERGSANIYPFDLFGQRIVGNEAYVTISNVWNEMDALPLAERHCGKFGKVPRFKAFGGARAVFDCVPRG
jgi:hypothetical protein